MARFLNAQFFGIAPTVPPRKLADGMAQTSVDADLSLSSELRPLHENATVGPLSAVAGGIKRLYLYEDQHWFEFTDALTDVVKGPLPDDPTARVYITDSQYPKVTRNDLAISVGNLMPAASYRLGVPAPTSAPATVVSGTGDASNTYFTSYVYTYVTSWGEEGPPSAPSALTSVDPGQTVTVTVSVPPSGAYSWQTIRIYRLNTGSNGTEYQFVDEITSATTTYADTKLSEELAEVLPSETWQPPPDENHPTGPLLGLLGLPNGSLAGFTGQTLCLSTAYLPHAWPYEARYPVGEDIVALSRVPNGLVVLTDGVPYLATGTSPVSVSLSPLPDSQACVSKRSVVDMGAFTLYASPEGLVAIDGGNVTVLTASMFSESEWRETFNPSSIVAFYWEGQYIAFYNTGTVQGGFIVNPRGEKAAFSLLSDFAQAGFYNPPEDRLYLNVGGTLEIFSSPDELPREFTWHSREYQSPMPTSMAAIRLAGYGPVQVEVLADGAVITTQSVTLMGEAVLRVPSGYRTRRWSVRLTGIADIERFDLVSGVMELQS